jgi:putative DNA primase/helicase
LAPVEFDPAAKCPVFDSFITKILNHNSELARYVQQLIGYSFTGRSTVHILPFAYGTGSNGKSTLVETILEAQGPDYSMKAPPDLLLKKKSEAHPTERADLFGKRFVPCVEVEEGKRMAEALAKELTGGDRIRARRMREDFWEFNATHHVWIVGNHKPVIVGDDHGIWRRIKLLPFGVVIPDNEQDPDLKDKLKAELPGILNWILSGCQDWQAHGLKEPEIVRQATRSYAADMDDFGKFLDECCERGENFVVGASELYRKFQEANPESPIHQKAFAERLHRHGFTNKNPETGGDLRLPDGRAMWKGLRLRVDPLALTIVEANREKAGK